MGSQCLRSRQPGHMFPARESLLPPSPLFSLSQESFRESKEVRNFFNLAEVQSHIFCYEYYCIMENSRCPSSVWKVRVSVLMVT